MRFRRPRAQRSDPASTPEAPDELAGELDTDAEDAADAADDEIDDAESDEIEQHIDDIEPDLTSTDSLDDAPAVAGDDDEDEDDDEPAEDDSGEEPDADNDEEDASGEEEFDDPAPTGRFAWLKPRKKKIDYGPDFTVRVATLPDLERFPEDGHVHPEIVRSWMALQQFGEAMLLVSWVDRTPAGYVLVSWTGDWDDAVRAEHPDTPALGNLWADEKYADDDVERKLVEAAITVCEKQGKPALLATVEADNTKVRDELTDLGFELTTLTTSETYVYRDATGKKRRGSHDNVVLLKKL